MQCIWGVGLVTAVGSHLESAIVVVLIYVFLVLHCICQYQILYNM